jgi:A/G-specific adenine glycosylase
MMDLGATLCTRSKPNCLQCPLQSGCQAQMLGLQARYPIPKPRKVLPQKHTLMPLLINRDNAILLYRRPPSGLWGGLWSLPELQNRDELTSLALQHNLRLGQQHPMASLKHTFSHFQLTIEPQLLRVEHSANAVAEGDWLWYNLANPQRLGLAAPVKKLLKRAAEHLTAGELS